MACSVHCSHDNLCRELSSLHHSAAAWYNKGIQPVHPYVLYVYVCNKVVQDLSFGISDVVLQFGQQGHGSCRWHGLKHVLLPVLAHQLCLGGHIGVQAALYQFALHLIGDHTHYASAIILYCLTQLLSSANGWCKHHLCGSLQVLLLLYIAHIAILAVGLYNNCCLKVLKQHIQGVGHTAHGLCLVIPNLHLGRICTVLLVKSLVYFIVHPCRVLCAQGQLIVYHLKTLQHVAADIQRQHGHQHNVHQIYHLLTGRYLLLNYLSHDILLCGVAQKTTSLLREPEACLPYPYSRSAPESFVHTLCSVPLSGQPSCVSARLSVLWCSPAC